MDTVIRISRPEDVVAYAPYALGFRPRESAVFIGMRAGVRRLGLTMRVDLAGLAHPQASRTLIAEITDCLSRDGCDDAFVIFYTDEPRDSLADHPVVGRALELVRGQTSWADQPGPWVVGESTYGCWGHGETCAPALGDVRELEHGWLAATMVAHGVSSTINRGALHVPRTARPERRRTAVRAAHRARQTLEAAEASAALQERPADEGGDWDGLLRDPLNEWREAQWSGWRQLVLAARDGRRLPAHRLGALAVAMDDPRFRDGVLYSVVRGAPRTVPSPAMAVAVLDEVVGAGGPAPDRARLRPAETVLRATVACLGAARGGHALAVLAWAAWWSGDGARADVLSQQVLGARPGTRLAELVQQVLDAHVMPGWAARARADDVDRRSLR